MPVLQFTSRKTIVFNTKRYCVKPRNFEPQLLHQELFTHEEFMVHSGKHLFFLGRWTWGFGATTSGLIFISPSWMSARENQEGTSHSSATHWGAAWCWSASSWNVRFDGSMVCWQPHLQCFKFLLKVNSSDSAPLIPMQVQLHKPLGIKLSIQCISWPTSLSTWALISIFQLKLGTCCWHTQL